MGTPDVRGPPRAPGSPGAYDVVVSWCRVHIQLHSAQPLVSIAIALLSQSQGFEHVAYLGIVAQLPNETELFVARFKESRLLMAIVCLKFKASQV